MFLWILFILVMCIVAMFVIGLLGMACDIWRDRTFVRRSMCKQRKLDRILQTRFKNSEKSRVKSLKV
jgi:uncharacterized iron-regulated membrane protein